MRTENELIVMVSDLTYSSACQSYIILGVYCQSAQDQGPNFSGCC